jgi:hypothetical protein
VKEALWPQNPAAGDPFEARLDALVLEVCDDFEYRAGRVMAAANYTWLLYGEGTSDLLLPQGPLGTVTSVHEVTYGDDGAGGRTTIETLVPASQYLPMGLLADGWKNRGYLRRIGGCWSTRLRYKVIAAAGFTTIPEKVKGVCTAEVCVRFNSDGPMSGLMQETTADDGTKVTVPRLNQDATFERAVAPWRLRSIG